MTLSIAAAYGLVMKGGDLIGAYLIIRANVNFPVHIKTPQGYTYPPGFCFQAVGNLCCQLIGDDQRGRRRPGAQATRRRSLEVEYRIFVKN